MNVDAPQKNVQTPNILVVDDRRENLIATRKLFRNINAELMEADSGNEALQMMLHNHFACVLLDVQMPEMDGFEVAAIMREQEEMKDIPIIFVTAISKEEKYVDQAAALGAVDYIFKPINSNILKSKVQVFVDLFQRQQQLNSLNDELSRNNDELERFAYICSHDLQEPARIMQSFAELLTKEYYEVLDDKGQKYLNFVTTNATNMRRMIRDILSFSRVGRESIEYEPVDPNHIVMHLEQEFAHEIHDLNATIDVGELPQVNSNHTLMANVLQNLIANALKFQPKERAPYIAIHAQEELDHWVFSVRDNGIGIPQEHAGKVFTMFQRIHRKDLYPGTGIGLSACKN